MKINPYLNFSGNTEEAFNCYKSVFGGEFVNVTRFRDTPESSRVPDNEKDKMMHIALPLGDGDVLMGTDALESMGHKLTPGNNMSLTISAASREDADRIYKGLSAGGKNLMPMAEQFWGAYFGMLTDRFDIHWMISHEPKAR
ncbi:MAG: VOC family protein [Bacteroidetes bacterium]|nr:VOC family protein [Bacteroidota bacterium]